MNRLRDAMAEPHPHRPTLQDAEAICRKAGTRLTRLRRQVLSLLLEADGPVTAYELLDRLRSERSATAAGIYRSLDFLLANGLAHRLESRKAFVACIHPDHPHVSQFLICRRCGTAVEVEDERISSVVGEWSRRLGFEVEAESLEVSGSCATCRTLPGEAAPSENCD
jgi:Fur family transcriptional regulator, zinc uptake regulator